jgi:HK97 family phage major capsid protein
MTTATAGGRAPVEPVDPDIVIPTKSKELEEMLTDPKVMPKVWANKDSAKEFMKNYAKTFMEKDASLSVQIKEQTQLYLAEFLTEQREKNGAAPLDLNVEQVNRMPQARGKKGIYNKRAPGAALDKQYADTAEFMQAIWHHAGSLPDADSLRNKVANARRIQNSFGSTVPGDGGFLIPETLRAEILQVALETAAVRPRARVIPMDSLRVPIPSVDDTSHASSVYGGIVAYWTEEGAALTESQASFGRVMLEAKKLTAYCEIPNELVADAPAFSAFLDGILPEAVAYYEDLAFIAGSGVGEPLGFMNGPAAIAVARNTPSTVKWPDLVGMYARMLPASLGRAVWFVSPDTLPQLLQMTVSGATIPLWLTGGQGFEAPTLSILGRPVVITEKVTAMGTLGDVNFVDLGYYLIGDRQVMQATSSPHFKFSTDKTAYRIIERVDGRPWLNSAITPKNGGATLSPIVQLAT